MKTKKQQLDFFNKLLDVMHELREKCPWDKEQTILTLRNLTIEETYELADAVIEEDWEEIKKELGDLMLHIVFYSEIATEKSKFDIGDVMDSLLEKLIERHPHIYGDVKATDTESVKRNWEKIKLKNNQKSVLDGVPKSLPSMIKASRIQEKTAGVGFDWDTKEQVFSKVKEELEEFQVAYNREDAEMMSEELGDLFFSLINFARHCHIDPEAALEKTNKKFIKRFQFIEHKAHHQNKPVHALTNKEMELYWEEAKKQENETI